MSKIIYKRPVPVMKFVFGIAFFIYGAIWAASNLFGIILCGIAVFFFHTDGIEIDLKKRTYRTIFSVFGMHFGKWKTLPDIEYVSVFKTTETTTVRAVTAEANVKNDVIKLNLFYNGNHRIEAYNTTNEKDAFEKAREIAQILNIDILDATQPESKWL